MSTKINDVRAQPSVQRRVSDEDLPPLPRGDEEVECVGLWNGQPREGTWTAWDADSMRAYARAALESLAPAQQQDSMSSWPVASAQEAKSGWTWSGDWMEQLIQKCEEASGYDASLEFVDALLSELSPQPAQPSVPLIARPLAEWHEDDRVVMWWAWCGHEWAGEPAWCGTPLDSDWPGYHTHWTPHPTLPQNIAEHGKGGA